MTTGAEFPNFTNKRLMSFQDFASRTIGYLQELNREVTEIQFSQGAFSEKLPMDSPGSNQVRLNVKPTVGDYKVHDGNGHLLDLQNDNVAVFENTAAITYEVGAGRIDQPVEIAINPRTGKPDYDRYVEAVGDEAEPNSVTDNGANITFRVDSLIANGGESLAGRTVRVFKKIPADDATTEAVAIEELTVSFGGGQNTVTTSGLLGQATVSTTPSDYLLQLVGLSVRRTTNPAPLSASNSHFFAGTVLGNGGTPVTFDIANQFTIQADTASDINFVPYTTSSATPINWDIAATDVQNAIEEIVDELSTVGSAGLGGNLVGTNVADFTTSVVGGGNDSGGIGASGDPDEPNSVQEALKNLDRRVVARRSYTAILADGTTRSIADYTGANAIDQINALGDGGRYLIHGDGGTPYEFSAATGFGAAAEYPEVVGAQATGARDGYPTVTVPSGAGAAFPLRGSFRRLHLRSDSATHGYRLGFSATLGGARVEDCGVDAGSMNITGWDASITNPQRAVVIRDVEFSPGGNSPYQTAFQAAQSTGNAVSIVFENCLFRGPSDGAPAAACLDITGFQVSSGEFASFTFRDCVFVHEDGFTTIPTVRINNANSGVAVNMINCDIYGCDDQQVTTPTLLKEGTAPLNMDGVRIFTYGKGYGGSASAGHWRDVKIIGATSRTTPATSDIRIFSCSTTTVTNPSLPKFVVDGLTIVIQGAQVGTTNGTSGLVEFGGNGGPSTGEYIIRNCRVYLPGTQGKSSGVVINGANDNIAPFVDGLQVVNVKLGDTSSLNSRESKAVVEILSQDVGSARAGVGPIVRNLLLDGIEKTVSDDVSLSLVYVKGGYVDTVVFRLDDGSTNDIQCLVKTDHDTVSGNNHNRTQVHNIYANGASTGKFACTDAPVVMEGAGDLVTNLDLTGWVNEDPGAFVFVKMTSAAANGFQEFIGGFAGGDNASGGQWADLGAGQYNRVSGIVIESGNEARAATPIVGTGLAQKVDNCRVVMDGSAYAEAIELTGNYCATANNMLGSSDATPLTVDNAGTGAVNTGNAFPVSVP